MNQSEANSLGCESFSNSSIPIVTPESSSEEDLASRETIHLIENLEDIDHKSLLFESVANSEENLREKRRIWIETPACILQKEPIS